jgi:ribosomal protein S20
MSLVITGLLGLSFGCGNRNQVSSVEASVKQPEPTTSAEPKSGESKSVDPQVQSEIDKAESEKRATLLKDAQSAIDETRNALAALDKGDKDAALQALSRATGNLDLVISRDPKLALAPVGVSTTIFDLYTNADTVKTVVKQAKDDLSNNQVQRRSRLVDLPGE